MLRKIIAIITLLLMLAACQPQEPHAAYGTIELEQVLLSSNSGERIRSLLVQKGDTVQAGQAVLQFHDELVSAQLQQAQAELQRAQANLALLEAGTRSETLTAMQARQQALASQLAESQRQLKRRSALFAQGVLAVSAVDEMQAQVDTLTAQSADLAAQLLELQHGQRPQTIAAAAQAVAAAEASVTFQQQRLAELTLLAPTAGTIEDLPWHIGERPTAAAPLVVIAAAGSAYARVYIPEQSLAQFTVGREVPLWLDGQTQPLTGKVRFVSAQASFTPYFALHQQERSRLSYVVEMALISEQPLQGGLPVRVDLP